MKGYEQGRQYFKSTMNEQCGVQDEVCLEPSCDDINNPEKDCTAKLCFDPCDMDKRTCEFNYVDESGNQASSDCNNQLNDLEYWQNTRLEPIWAELFERDQQYIRIWYYLDEYHGIPETMDEWKDHGKLDEMDHDYDYDYDYERVNPACGVDETICLQSRLSDWDPSTPADEDSQMEYCFDPCAMSIHDCTIDATGESCLPALRDPW
jgi:hypothetical protein